MITVYSQPNCMQCKMTKNVLEREGIPFNEIDVSQNGQALEYVRSLGFQSLPVVEIEGEEPFYGFRPDDLEKLAGHAKYDIKVIERGDADYWKEGYDQWV